MDSENESHSDDSNEERTHSDNGVDAEEKKRIREEVSNMSFEDLQKLKQQMGSKQYNETVFGVSAKRPKTDFKRVNKNRPREMSSKIRPKVSRAKSEKYKPASRDPRFDPLCGAYDKETFSSNYKFLNEVKRDEKKELLREQEECEDPRRQKQIKLLVQRIDNQLREHEKKEVEVKKRKEEKQEFRDKLKKGERPTFKKKSEKRIEDLVDKYEELKKSNRLHKHIEKRSKKLATKERIRLEKAVVE